MDNEYKKYKNILNKLVDDNLPDGHWGKFKAKYNPSKMAFKSGSK